MTSIFGISESARMAAAAPLTLVNEVRSMGKNLTRMEGLMALIVEMVGWILARSRPRRMSVEGEA